MNSRGPVLIFATVVAFLITTIENKAAAQSITVTPANATIPLGGTQQFAAPEVSNAAGVDAGDYHACILLQNSEARCSGFNGTGQLGNGQLTDSSTPVRVLSIADAVGVASGGFHSCAVLRNGSVACWGSNTAGQLGDGTTTNSALPVAVAGITTAIAVAAGYHHSCALLQDGTVRCWGDNTYGELGDGTPIDPTLPRGTRVLHSSVPVAVLGINTAVNVTASDGYHSCAALRDGTVRCWGDNSNGQIGDGTHHRTSTPVMVTGLTTAVAVSSGDFHTCALLNAGGVSCWGLNWSGQLGDGTGNDSTTPVQVSSITTAVGVSVGVIHTCATLQDRTVRCWGNNASGQIGDGTTTDRRAPVMVSGITTATGSVAAGNNDSCAVIQGGLVKCWGMNTYGELGNGTTVDTSVPTPVIGINATWTTSDSSVATIDATGLATSLAGGTATITAAFEGRTGSAVLTVGMPNILTVALDGDGMVTSSSGAIDCGTTCSASYPVNATETLTATPLNGSGFVGWNGCDSHSATTCTVTITSARSVSATFRKPTFTLMKAGPGRGSVVSSDSRIDCRSDLFICVSDYDIGATFTLTASPIYGSQFASWSGCQANGSFCSVTMDASKTATATFTLSRFLLTVDKPGLGSGTVTSAPGGINCGPTCAGSYDYGTVVTLTATPALGSIFNGWSGCDTTSNNQCTVAIGADKWVSANFLGLPLP
jgi:alpha-tubulin suppressor-like RCC1 family protein